MRCTKVVLGLVEGYFGRAREAQWEKTLIRCVFQALFPHSPSFLSTSFILFLEIDLVHPCPGNKEGAPHSFKKREIRRLLQQKSRSPSSSSPTASCGKSPFSRCTLFCPRLPRVIFFCLLYKTNTNHHQEKPKGKKEAASKQRLDYGLIILRQGKKEAASGPRAALARRGNLFISSSSSSSLALNRLTLFFTFSFL